MSYNYKKVFFRRPILSQSNLIFFWFLFFTIVTIVPTVIWAVYFFDKIPTQSAIREFKDYTFSRLINISRSEIVRENTGEMVQPLPGSGELLSEDSPGEKPANPGPAPTVLTSPAAENNQRQESALVKYQQSRKTYQENINEYNVSDDDGVRISSPSFTDFGVVQGYRSFEETIAVGSEGKRFVERCLDRFFRIHPRFRGKMIVKFDVHPRGHVIAESIKIIHSDIDHEPLLECMKKSIRRWVIYPEVPAERGIYQMTQKYIF